MLSKREQRALDDIEMRLVTEDPRFCARMTGPGTRSRARLRLALAYLGIVAVGLAAIVSFIAGLWITGAAFLGAGTVIAGTLVFAKHRRRRGRRG